MPEYVWRCLNKQYSEHLSGPKYSKILNMVKSWIWQGSQYVSDAQHSEYTRTCLDRADFWIGSGSKYANILNMAGFWICKSYTGF